MVEETEKSATTAVKEELEDLLETKKNYHNAGGDESEAEEGEIVGGDPDDAARALAPPPARHPLEHSWTFWFDNPSVKSKQEAWKSKQEAWGSSIRPIYTFSTVEDFWSVYNNIHHPSKLSVGADFYCFKNKIEPVWEDPVCANGGKWTIIFSKGKSDTPFLYTLLAMIGEQFDYGDEICGAVVNVRGKQERISIWTKNASNEAAQLFVSYSNGDESQCKSGLGNMFAKVSIGRQWKEILDYKESIGFIVHADAKRLDRQAKNLFTA